MTWPQNKQTKPTTQIPWLSKFGIDLLNCHDIPEFPCPVRTLTVWSGVCGCVQNVNERKLNTDRHKHFSRDGYWMNRRHRWSLVCWLRCIITLAHCYSLVSLNNAEGPVTYRRCWVTGCSKGLSVRNTGVEIIQYSNTCKSTAGRLLKKPWHLRNTWIFERSLQKNVMAAWVLSNSSIFKLAMKGWKMAY